MLTMLRGPAVLTCLIIVLMCVIGFGFNSYRSITIRLRRSDEYSDKLRSQYDAMIAQIRGKIGILSNGTFILSHIHLKPFQKFDTFLELWKKDYDAFSLLLCG